MPLLDATYLIDAENDPDKVEGVMEILFRRAAEQRDPILVSYAVALEVAAGSEDPGARLAELERGFMLVPLGRDELLEAARLARSVVASGRRPPWHDIETAAIARLRGTFVVSRNARDFKALGCKAWHYGKEPAPPP